MHEVFNFFVNVLYSVGYAFCFFSQNLKVVCVYIMCLLVVIVICISYGIAKYIHKLVKVQ